MTETENIGAFNISTRLSDAPMSTLFIILNS